MYSGDVLLVVSPEKFSSFLGLRLMLLIPDSYYEGKDIGRLNEIKNWDKRTQQFKDIVGNININYSSRV